MSGSPIARHSQCCMHTHAGKFSPGSLTSRLRFNVLPPSVITGGRALKYCNFTNFRCAKIPAASDRGVFGVV